MKTLDDRIVFTLSVPTGNTSGMYIYELYLEDVNLPEGEELLFVGNFYYSGGVSKSMDVTDIIRSLKPSVSLKKVFDEQTVVYPNQMVKRFRVKLYFSNTPTVSSWEYVAMVYKYPNRKLYLRDDEVFFTPNSVGNTTTTLLQGKVYNGAYKVIPHYPRRETPNMKFCQTFLPNNPVQQITLTIDNDSHSGVTFSTSFVYGGTMCAIPLDDLVWDYESYIGANALVKDTNGFVIAEFDTCHKRYYLQWQDRYGGIQCQALDDNYIYTESFDVTETQNYKNERKKSGIQVQPKWKLSTGWLTEEAFPIYESIFVSPSLLLYDSELNVAYDVITNGSYTEETHKNKRTLLNLTIELEAISKQNIIY